MMLTVGEVHQDSDCMYTIRMAHVV